MSSKLLHLDPFAQAIARREREEAERSAGTATASTSPIAPTENTAPTIIEAPVEIRAPVKRARQPLQKTAATEITAPTVSEGAKLLPANSAHLRTPHEIIDKILPTLKPTSQTVLLRLYRLSAGFDSWTCKVSVPKLANMCHISDSQVRICLRELSKRKLVRKIREDLSNPNQQDRGIEFEVLLPRLARGNSTGATEITGAAKSKAPTESVPNKVNTQKENTQTQDAPAAGVRVGSRFTIEECRRYADHLRSTGQGINNPGGYATTIHRTGEADELIKRFLSPAPASAETDTSACPDCQGTGFYYPKGVEQGVAKCRHENLVPNQLST